MRHRNYWLSPVSIAVFTYENRNSLDRVQGMHRVVVFGQRRVRDCGVENWWPFQLNRNMKHDYMSNESIRQREIYPSHEDYFECIPIRNPSSSGTLPSFVSIYLFHSFFLSINGISGYAPTSVLHRRRHFCKLHTAPV